VSLFIVENYEAMDITLFRLLRLAKLLRMVKLIRTVEHLDALQLMTTSLYSSISALCWAVILLFIMQSCRSSDSHQHFPQRVPNR
jgi:hypothetical protein